MDHVTVTAQIITDDHEHYTGGAHPAGHTVAGVV